MSVSNVVVSHSCLILSPPHSYKLKVDACEQGSPKERKLRGITVNYLYVSASS